jgi:putative sigma-54 modulation protein
MKCNVRFKGIQSSKALTDYANDRFDKLKKYEIKPTVVNVTFSESRHERVAEIYVNGMQKSLRAKASSDSFYAAFDQCMEKLERQFEKQKAKIKDHRGQERTHEYLLEELLKREREDSKKVA